ncbi:uncharacterized protein LOC123878993 isoform X1 [Maniola jurtina]|uniref:uncharacterized protein LOC123878993 isoform X1 n=1 Tax=Maniola jurtina TaxID=191418 RepID=UPI001E6888B4|nr:uncharacterized protein LOC123878993 isoform X1 [Maniola jurtina]XP_045782405.1 uncharacterized protein LOC123878993 isoform X1 [Maniola jurtina]
MEAPGSGLNLEKVVKEQLVESIKNADILSMLQKMVDSAPESEETDEIRQRLQEILAHYNTLEENEKTYFLAYIKNALTSKLAAKLDEVPMDMSELEGAIHGAIMSQIYMVAAAGVILLLLLVFFGYKLYKSIKEKEKKREEKKKLKQMKKKK